MDHLKSRNFIPYNDSSFRFIQRCQVILKIYDVWTLFDVDVDVGVDVDRDSIYAVRLS